MSKKHKHKFIWNDYQAYYLCRCGAKEARCKFCGKRSGKADGVKYYFCSDECEAKWDGLGDECQGLANLLKV